MFRLDYFNEDDAEWTINLAVVSIEEFRERLRRTDILYKEIRENTIFSRREIFFWKLNP